MKLNETIKNALDPKGILAPGKNGIWPKVSPRSKVCCSDADIVNQNYDAKAWAIPAPQLNGH